LSGLETKFVEVRVRLTDETGVQPTVYRASEQMPTPALQVNNFLNSWILLRLLEGTDQEGIWAGSLPVTSAWSGTVEPTRFYASKPRARSER
jgi:hypothetical protein